MGFVTSQLVPPYRGRPNEGSLSIYTEFSPMADPSFEAGRPGESAVELGRIIDRGLRESRAVDTESLCVLAGKLVWSIRVDLHILDNGGNLVDAANVAALAALMTFRMPECKLGGEDGQEVIVHPPEVLDPTHSEEAVMGGRMTATLNTNGDVCAIQKAGGAGVIQSAIMQCLRIASVKAADITMKIKDAVEVYSTERAQRKIKRLSSVVPVAVNVPDIGMKQQNHSSIHKDSGNFPRDRIEAVQDEPEEPCSHKSSGIDDGTKSAKKGSKLRTDNVKKFTGAPSSWDPYTTGIDSDLLKTSLASPEEEIPSREDNQHPLKVEAEEPSPDLCMASSGPNEARGTEQQKSAAKTLKDAVKPKSKRRKKPLSGNTVRPLWKLQTPALPMDLFNSKGNLAQRREGKTLKR